MGIKTIIVATGNSKLDNAFSMIKGYEIVDTLQYKKNVVDSCEFYKPDILVISDALRGSQSTKELLFKIKSTNPAIRIIYIVGEVDMRNLDRVNSLGYLVLSGIYDIITEKKFNLELLKDILANEKEYEDVKYFTRGISKTEKVEEIFEFEEEEEEEEEDNDNPYNKIITFSSNKPGSGKTTIALGVAAAIAKYGKDKPRVAVIEGDLQNLSVGTVLQLPDDGKFNLKTALDKIATLFNEEGELIASDAKIDEVNKFIKNCFKPYYYAKNLKAITGSQIRYEQLKDVKPYYYVYLIEAILDDYDLIIIDSNSNLSHPTTEPLLFISRVCYYILSLEFNNIRNNFRYQETLKNMKIFDKVKYILNEDIDEDDSFAGTDIEELEFTKEHLREVGFELAASIPLLPKTVFLNRVHSGKPVSIDENNEHTAKAKYAFLELANQLWEIENLDQYKVQKDAEDQIGSKKNKKRFWGK